MSSAFMGEERIAPDEERLVLLKPVGLFSFTYGVLRGLLFIYLTLITSLFMYCDIVTITDERRLQANENSYT